MGNGGTVAGWYPDPSGSHESRYWNGNEWTEDVPDRGVPGKAGLLGPPPPVVYRGGRYAVGGGLSLLFMVALAIACVAIGEAVLGLLLIAVLIPFFCGARRWCLRVELSSNRDLAVRYYHHRALTNVGAVREIAKRRKGGGSDFKVDFDGGAFVLGDTKSAREMVDELLRLNPSLTRKGFKR